MKVKPQLVQLWVKIIQHLSPPTKALVKDHLRLIEFDIEKNIATLTIRNQHFLPFAKKRQPDLERAD